MSDQETPDGLPDPEQSSDDQENQAQTHEIQHSHISALVPEGVARGVFSTGAVILQGGHEFIIDFLLRMAKPQQVAARIVLPIAVVPRMIAALRQNVDNYEKKFGKITIPKAIDAPNAEDNPPGQQLSPQDLYEQLKMGDDVISGSYSNAVMVGHTATEFSFDFITNFFPRSAVASRVFLSAPNVPKFLDSLTNSYQQFERKKSAQQQPDAGQTFVQDVMPPPPPPDFPDPDDENLSEE